MSAPQFENWKSDVPPTVIGIDPDLVKSGVAFVKGGQLLDLQALEFFDLINLINERKGDALFVLEDVESNKATFHRKGTNEARRKKIAQNVGQVKAICRLLKQYLEGCGACFQVVRPLTGPVKKKAKNDAEYFNKITGWTGRTNEDKRDAGLLALYGVK